MQKNPFNRSTYNTPKMILVQTSPCIGQLLKSNGDIDILNDMSGTYKLYDNFNNHLIGSAIVQRHNTYSKPCLDILLPCGFLSFEEVEYCKCWLSSFANVICHTNLTSLLRDSLVLELGAGVGISGITLAKCNPSSYIVISDGFEPLSCNIKNNIKNNATNNATFKVIKWGDKMTYHSKMFDLIIGCECLYHDDGDDERSQNLVDAILHHLKDDGKAVFLNTPPPYRKGVETFIDKLQSIGSVTTRDLCLVHNDNHQAPFVLIDFQKKKITN